MVTRAYVVTLLDIPQSVEMAERCIASGKKYGIEVEKHPAIYKDKAEKALAVEGLKRGNWDESYSNPTAVIGNFVSQFNLWKRTARSLDSAIILEHDAVFTAEVPDLEGKGHIINLGKPSYGRYKSKSQPGIYPMFSKPGGYIPGAHAYYITHIGANWLVETSHKRGAHPVDLFLCRQNFKEIKELYPWVAEARDEFSTIQNEKGCKAKHNYSDKYKVL